ncbi:MAG: DUF4124 domain-containing protein [Gammaproteobacteria bacterium]|nr:DUF4124 domain-containing protein [Gammaproteobacteria bacterium]
MSRFTLILGIAALTMSGATVAGEIYKWTDENGNIQYMDRPSGVASEQRVNTIVSRRTDASRVQASVAARREHMTTLEERKAKRAEETQAAAEAQAEQERRQKRCADSRSRLEAFLRSQRLYREDESGERVYLDEEQILAARAKVQDQIQEYCD